MEVDLAIGAPGAPEVEVESGDVDAVYEPELEHELGPVPPVSDVQVRDLLDGLGRAVSIPLSLGVPGLWKFSSDELDALVPPMTRIVNKRPALARAVHNGDEVMVALHMAGYFGRRVDSVIEARKRREEEPDGDGEREAARDVASDDAPAGGAPSFGRSWDPNGGRGYSADR